MDDPWGSPWADEAAHKTVESDANAVKPKPTIIPPKPVSFDSTTKSPWDDDEGFGDWATQPEESLQETSPSAAANTDDDWDFQANDGLGAQGHKVTIAGGIESPWTTADDRSVEHPRLELQEPVVGNRQDLDASWAGPQAYAADDQFPASIQHVDKLEEVVIQDSSQVDEGAKDVTNERDSLQEESSIQSPVQKSQPPKDTLSDEIEVKALNDESISVEDHRTTAEGLFSAEQPEASEKEATVSSRPSLCLSDRSRHDEAPADSPGTSVEEEIRPALESRDSSKVKQLVHHFDALAIARVQSGSTDRSRDQPSDGSEHPSTSRRPSVEENGNEFGDFEEGVSYVSANGSSNGDVVSESIISPREDAQHPTKAAAPSQASVKEDEIIKPQGRVKFDIDMSCIDQLYPVAKKSTDSTDYEPLDIDNLVMDSFSTVEQRKMWYRISRYGSMRKYNAGGDDNFIWMDWVHSKVREETLKIAARWMEEDRIQGGLILGGGGRLASMFSWGKQGQAPVAEALPRVAALQSPSTSIPASMKSFGHSRQSSSISSTKTMPASAIEPSPHFGWSSTQPISTVPGPVTSSISSNSPVASSFPGLARISPGMTSGSAAIPPSQPQPPESDDVRSDTLVHSATDAEEDDDEWGEMVSSPITPSFPALPAIIPVTRGHKVSHSIMEVLNPSNASKSHPARHRRASSLSQELEAFKSDVAVNTTVSANSQVILKDLGDTPKPTPRNDDAWAGTDFSFFDTPSTTSGNIVSSTMKPFAMAQLESPGSVPLKFDNTPSPGQKIITANMPPPPTPPISNLGGKSKEELNQDRIVRDIIKDLPDLSYMFRR
jgi:hypothetical protein